MGLALSSALAAGVALDFVAFWTYRGVAQAALPAGAQEATAVDRRAWFDERPLFLRLGGGDGGAWRMCAQEYRFDFLKVFYFFLER